MTTEDGRGEESRRWREKALKNHQVDCGGRMSEDMDVGVGVGVSVSLWLYGVLPVCVGYGVQRLRYGVIIWSAWAGR
jgi:hypothetical protein